MLLGLLKILRVYFSYIKYNRSSKADQFCFALLMLLELFYNKNTRLLLSHGAGFNVPRSRRWLYLLPVWKQGVVFNMSNHTPLKAPPEIGQFFVDLFHCFLCCIPGYGNRKTNTFGSAEGTNRIVRLFGQPFYVLK